MSAIHNWVPGQQAAGQRQGLQPAGVETLSLRTSHGRVGNDEAKDKPAFINHLVEKTTLGAPIVPLSHVDPPACGPMPGHRASVGSDSTIRGNRLVGHRPVWTDGAQAGGPASRSGPSCLPVAGSTSA